MPSPNKWGPVTWRLFHSLIESLKDESFPSIYPQLFMQIKNLCSVLPCPICSAHASGYLSKITDDHINTKIKFRNMMYIFHNVVNAKNKKPGFLVQDLEKYKNANIVDCFNNCMREFNTNGNMNLIAESFHRKKRTSVFKKWLIINIKSFCFRPN